MKYKNGYGFGSAVYKYINNANVLPLPMPIENEMQPREIMMP